MDIPKDCPVVKSAENAARAGDNFVKAIRRLRRDLQECDTCPMNDDCKIRKEYNTMVDTAIAEVNAEWGMVGG